VIVSEIASALEEAHGQGIIHRDIKPGNVIFDGRGHAVLTDFGISKSLEASSLTETSVIIGTPDYIAPEQIDHRLAPGGQIDGRSDIYALGALLYRALTGQRPFDGSAQAVFLAHLQEEPPRPSTLVPELPPEVDAVVARAMAKHPNDRYSSAGELADDLQAALGDTTAIGTVFPPAALRRDAPTRTTTEALLGDEPVAAQPQIPVVRPRSRYPRAVLLALVLLILAGGLIFRYVTRANGNNDRDPSGIALAVGGSATATPSATEAPIITATTPTDSSTDAPMPPTAVEVAATLEPAVITTTSSEVPVESPTLADTAAPVETAAPATRTTPPATRTRPPATRTTPPVRLATPIPPAATALLPSATAIPPTPTEPPAPETPVPPTDTVLVPTETAIPPTETAIPPTPTDKAPAPTSTAEPVACAIPVQGGFGVLWTDNTRVQARLGCPLRAEAAGPATEQTFENGTMYWWGATQQIYVLLHSKRWSQYPNTWHEGEILEPLTPHEGLYAPERGFGKVWRTYPAVSDGLGWAEAPEQGQTGVYERFEHGTMLYSPRLNGHGAQIYVLYSDGTFATYPDTAAAPD
jgi:hypothetical protein